MAGAPESSMYLGCSRSRKVGGRPLIELRPCASFLADSGVKAHVWRAIEMQRKTLPRGEHDVLPLRSFGEPERVLDGTFVCADPGRPWAGHCSNRGVRFTARMGGQQLSALTKFRGLANDRCAS